MTKVPTAGENIQVEALPQTSTTQFGGPGLEDVHKLALPGSITPSAVPSDSEPELLEVRVVPSRALIAIPIKQ
jgi:hypothetical protein